MTKNLAYISKLTKVSLQLQHRALNNTYSVVCAYNHRLFRQYLFGVWKPSPTMCCQPVAHYFHLRCYRWRKLFPSIPHVSASLFSRRWCRVEVSGCETRPVINHTSPPATFSLWHIFVSQRSI